jgi:hypothetical protein
MNKLTKECLTELGLALKRFGTYSFDDKGPHEVMHLPSLLDKFRELSATEAAEVLRELAASPKYSNRGSYLAETLLAYMEDWEELWAQPGIEDLAL